MNIELKLEIRHTKSYPRVKQEVMQSDVTKTV